MGSGVNGGFTDAPHPATEILGGGVMILGNVDFPKNLVVAVATLSLLPYVWGHGRLMDPPARNSMWRFGYINPINYNDNEVFCGGVSHQFEKNGGRCGEGGAARGNTEVSGQAPPDTVG